MLSIALLVVAGCDSAPGVDAVTSADTVTTSPADSSAGPSDGSASRPAPPTAGSESAEGSDGTFDQALTYTEGGADIRLVSYSFTGALPGYRIVDGTDTLDAPTSIAVAADDSDLYVITGDGLNSRLIRLGDGMDSWDLLDRGPDAPIDQPFDVATGPDHTVAVLNAGTGRVSVSHDGADTWTGIGLPAGSSTPSAVAISTAGAIVVSDAGANTVSISADGAATWDTVDQATGSFDAPTDVAGSPDGTLYVLNGGDGSLSISRPGSGTWENITAAAAGWIAPQALATGPAGEVFVTDPGSDGIYRSLDSGRTWIGSDGFANITGVAVGSAGEIYLSDAVNTLITLQAAPGAVVGLTAVPGAGPGEVTVSWQGAEGAGSDTSYAVSADYTTSDDAIADAPTTGDRDSPDEPDPVRTVLTGTTAAIAGLSAGREIAVTVVASNAAGFGLPAITTLTLS